METNSEGTGEDWSVFVDTKNNQAFLPSHHWDSGDALPSLPDFISALFGGTGLGELGCLM